MVAVVVVFELAALDVLRALRCHSFLFFSFSSATNNFFTFFPCARALNHYTLLLFLPWPWSHTRAHTDLFLSFAVGGPDRTARRVRTCVCAHSDIVLFSNKRAKNALRLLLMLRTGSTLPTPTLISPDSNNSADRIAILPGTFRRTGAAALPGGSSRARTRTQLYTARAHTHPGSSPGLLLLLMLAWTTLVEGKERKGAPKKTRALERCSRRRRLYH